jgi:hypothetical protein
MRKTMKNKRSQSQPSAVSLKDPVRRAKALSQSAEQLFRHVSVSVLGELTNGATSSSDADEISNEVDRLLEAMQGILNQQQAAANSRSQCWISFVANTEGIRKFLAQKRAKHEALTQQDQLKIASELEGALVAYNKCMLLPRPKRLPGGVAGGGN